MKQILKFTIEEAQNQLTAFFSKDSMFKGNIEVKIEADISLGINDNQQFCENTAGLTKLSGNLILIKESLAIPKTDGSKYIYGNTKVFKYYIDDDFKNWGLDKKSEKTNEVKVNVFELIKDSTLKEIFTDPKKQAMTQHQIIEFCKNHEEDLRQGGSATFFLTKVGKEYFVVYVYVFSGGLDVYVYRLERGPVWDGEYRPRVVSPQL